MKNFQTFIICLLMSVLPAQVYADYDRNKAVPVERVLFGSIQSVRNITEREIIEDRKQGWKVFGGALLGGVLGSQIGSGSGRDIATVLGAIIGGTTANNRNPQYREKTIELVELMIVTDNGDEYMVVQDRDNRMQFNAQDMIRLIYLANGTVRVDKQM